MLKFIVRFSVAEYVGVENACFYTFTYMYAIRMRCINRLDLSISTYCFPYFTVAVIQSPASLYNQILKLLCIYSYYACLQSVFVCLCDHQCV